MLIAIAAIAQLVEHNLAKVGVASSNLVFRSRPEEAEMFEMLMFVVRRTAVAGWYPAYRQ